MSDIHGNTKRFDSVLSQIDLKPEDTLYILGDVVDRYPDGIAILQRIMKMPNVKMLLGNHEYMMLNVLAGSKHDEVEWGISDWSDLRRLWAVGQPIAQFDYCQWRSLLRSKGT